MISMTVLKFRPEIRVQPFPRKQSRANLWLNFGDCYCVFRRNIIHINSWIISPNDVVLPIFSEFLCHAVAWVVDCRPTLIVWWQQQNPVSPLTQLVLLFNFSACWCRNTPSFKGAIVKILSMIRGWTAIWYGNHAAKTFFCTASSSDQVKIFV